jgi:putative ABC transport system permease protein
MHRSRILRNIHLGIKSLLLHKLRSFLTVLGVVFGVGSVIAMLAVGEGASKQALEEIKKLGSHNIILRTQKPEKDDDSGSDTTRNVMQEYGLEYIDEQRIRETLPDVTLTVPAKTIWNKARVDDRASWMRVVGTTPEWFRLVERELLAGRLLNEEDSDLHRNVCVITQGLREKFLGDRYAIGEHISLGGRTYLIVGVIRNDEGGANMPDTQVDAYIPMNVAYSQFGDREGHRKWIELHQIIVQVNSTDNVPRTAEALRHLLKHFHPREDWEMIEPLALLKQAEKTKRTFNVVLGAIAGISLLVGGIGIMNIMLASVTERTREIGIRRAIGAKRKQIVMQFLIETVVLSTVGGALGLGFGVLAPAMIEKFADMPTVIPTYSVVLSMGISIGVGVMFGLYPAIRAANLDPIQALRHE